MEHIKDIKENIIIPIDFLSPLFGLLLIIVSVWYYLYLKKKKKRKPTQKELAKKALLELNLEDKDAKEIAYLFTQNGGILVKDENKDNFLEIVLALEKYKYKKDISDDLDNELKIKIKEWIKGI